ncbi:hypothetical protein BDZ89DRAFT_1155653 [Hymenopellis radicata]|nr:hypothetical protein BDZ89DRAFT_1155653 [Hymenopellis radicata]
MPKSEIDDIFAAKGAAPLPVASSSLPKKKKTKKRRRDESQSATPALSSSSSKVVPVTVIDSSSLPPPPPKRAKKAKVKSAAPEGVSKTEDNFADSRGSSSRRTTEEGWSIYKEDELGMSKEGGGAYKMRLMVYLLRHTQIHRCVLLIVIAVSEYIYWW